MRTSAVCDPDESTELNVAYIDAVRTADVRRFADELLAEDF